MIIFAIIIFIVFLPINTKIFLLYDSKNQKLYFKILFFNFLTIFCGYLNKRENGGFYLHYSNRNAKIIEFNGFDGNFFNLPSFFIKKINYELIVKNKADNFLLISQILNGLALISNIIGKVINIDNYRGDFILKESKKSNVIFDLELNFYFNIFSILQYLITNIIKKGVKYAKKQWKQPKRSFV